MLHIRAAAEPDFPSITAIYNQIIATSTAVYREDPTTLDERLTWWRARREQGFPTLVACESEVVVGFSSFGIFRSAPCYRRTVEHTVHVHEAWRGRGIGADLVKALIPRAAALGMHIMIGGVDAANQASLRFHQRLGFQTVAHFREVGFKFNRYLDLLFVQLTIPSTGEPGIAQSGQHELHRDRQ